MHRIEILSIAALHSLFYISGDPSTYHIDKQKYAAEMSHLALL